jgi:predicted ATP-dependent endonuclease of OLD family
MRLTKARVTNFRSVEDSGEFTLEQVTCLVGKNEAGKSAVLLALAALNPNPITPVILDRERDYPRRHLTAYSQRHLGDEAVVVSTSWKLESTDLNALSHLGDEALKSIAVHVSRSYGKDPEWTITLDDNKVVHHVLKDGGFEDIQIRKLQEAETCADLIAKISSIPELSTAQQLFLDWLNKVSDFSDHVRAILAPKLPTFMYFSNYDRMAGAVQFEQIKQLQAQSQLGRDDRNGERLFLEFMDHAGVPLGEILNIRTYETFNAKLQAASNNITDQILEYWTQNPDLAVKVDVSTGKPGDLAPFNFGTIGRARIYNSLHRVDTPFSERSAGFVWFFSFLVKFAKIEREAKPVILLLDEPGLTLHGKAQADLLRYFDEKLAPRYQVIYSTHSAFMVSPNKLLSARIVEDKVETKSNRRVTNGTKVTDDVLTTDRDTLFPLQGALGYEITQTQFIGRHALLVEGPSDILYLQALSQAQKARNRTGLDPHWTMCPTGGIGNVRAFVSLFAGNKLDIAVLADQTKRDANKIEELRKSEILKTEKVFSFAEFTGKAESDAEDLFEPNLFLSIVNAAYDLTDHNKLTLSKLEQTDPNATRLVKKVEAAFNVMPDTVPAFDHFTPASWLIRNPAALEGTCEDIERTLSRAENLFATLKAAL